MSALPNDRRACMVRDYPALEVPLRGASAEVRGGEEEIDGIRGWILVFGFPGGTSSPDQLLSGQLDLRYPLRATTSYTVHGFDAGRGGILAIPWPYVGFSIKDCSREPIASTHRPSVAAVSLVPLLAEEPSPPGIGSTLYGRTRVSVPSAGIDLEVPSGATEYRVLPADELKAGKRFLVQERTGAVLWASYTIDPGEPIASGAALGHSAWKQTPVEPVSRIRLEHDDRGKRHATVYWRYELGQSR